MTQFPVFPFLSAKWIKSLCHDLTFLIQYQAQINARLQQTSGLRSYVWNITKPYIQFHPAFISTWWNTWLSTVQLTELVLLEESCSLLSKCFQKSTHKEQNCKQVRKIRSRGRGVRWAGDSFSTHPSPFLLTPSPLLPNFLLTPRALIFLPACSLACSISLPGIGKETAAMQARNLGEQSTNSKTIKVHIAK